MTGMPTPQHTKPGSAALRRGRWSEQGRVYLLTFTSHQRAAHFADWSLAQVAARAFAQTPLWRKSNLLCWVLMPDHWHGLVRLSGTETLGQVMSRVKAVTARSINAARADRGRVWSAGYHDHAVRDEEDLVALARYIVANPVRAGLCEHPGQYPFWDAIWLG